MNEFEVEQKLPAIKQKRSTTGRPNFDQCVELLVKKLAWTEEYAMEKMLPVITRWQVQAMSGK